MALWGSRQSDLQSRIDDIQTGLAALAGLLGDGASAAGKGAARGARAASDTATDAATSAASNTAAALGPVLSDLSNQIDSVLSAASALTGDIAKRGAKEGKAAYKAVEGTVENNAMMAVVAAAGVGFLIGTMIFGGGAAKRAVSNALPESLGGEPERPQRRRAAARSRTRGRPKRRRAA
jgi:ElaB/YqjD/DUF883 family membrane-anchored ribosome-binding protein